MTSESQPGLLYSTEYLSYLWNEYPYSFVASSVFSIAGVPFVASGIYMVPATISSFGIAAFNIATPEEYNLILPLFEKCHTSNSYDFAADVINDGNCIAISAMFLPSFLFFSVTMIPTVAVEHSIYKLIEYSNYAYESSSNQIIGFCADLVNNAFYGVQEN